MERSPQGSILSVKVASVLYNVPRATTIDSIGMSSQSSLRMMYCADRSSDLVSFVIFVDEDGIFWRSKPKRRRDIPISIPLAGTSKGISS
jgi:hypothetical protein